MDLYSISSFESFAILHRNPVVLKIPADLHIAFDIAFYALNNIFRLLVQAQDIQEIHRVSLVYRALQKSKKKTRAGRDTSNVTEISLSAQVAYLLNLAVPLGREGTNTVPEPQRLIITIYYRIYNNTF